MTNRAKSRKPLALWLGAALSIVLGAFCWLSAVMNGSFSVATDSGERFRSAARMWSYGGWLMFVLATALVIGAIKVSRTVDRDDRISGGA